MNEMQERVEQLRQMSTKKLVELLHWRTNRVQNLASALKPKNYNVLADKTLTAKEMAAELQLSDETVKTYRDCLIRSGAAEKKREHFAPHGKNSELILEKLNIFRPLTYSELEGVTGLNHYCIIEGVQRLKKQKKIYQFSVGRCYDFFGKLSKNVYLCPRSQNELAAIFIAENSPAIQELIEKPKSNPGLCHSVTHSLKKNLPTAIYDKLVLLYKDYGAIYAEARYNKINKGLETKLKA